MDKIKELLKKLKALAEKGVGGEAVNAQKLLDKKLKEHNLKLEDLFGDVLTYYYFSAKGSNVQLLYQIVKTVNYDRKLWSVPAKKVKELGINGNQIVECTAIEFVEIDQKYSVYKRLYKSELDVFFTAFLNANDLLIRPPKPKDVSDLSPKELEEYLRMQKMSKNIKSETFRKQLVAPNGVS